MVINVKKMNFEEASEKEWVITNGIGGFASSSIIGVNTRKYHGLLVAPFNPPGNRHFLVSKVDESIQIGNNNYIFYTNMCRNNISQGYKFQEEFSKEEIPTFKYNVKGIKIEKSICMEHGKNNTFILYKISNTDQKITLKLTPLLNYRNFHDVSKDREFEIKQSKKNNLVNIQIDGNEHCIYLNCSDGKYRKIEHDSFKNMFYYEEEKRGLSDEENHAIPGMYEIEILPNEEKYITFACSLDDGTIDQKDSRDIIEKEKIRIKKIIDEANLKGDKDLVKTYIIATDSFIVSRKKLYTLIAGYPWFLDWGRDNCISFEGTVLKTKRFDIARKILLTLTKDIKQGLVPNGYTEDSNRPIYNSVDSSLLLFDQVAKYIKYTKDYDFIKEKLYKKLKGIISNYEKGIDLDNNNIYLDEDRTYISRNFINTKYMDGCKDWRLCCNTKKWQTSRNKCYVV